MVQVCFFIGGLTAHQHRSLGPTPCMDAVSRHAPNKLGLNRTVKICLTMADYNNIV